MTLRNIPNSGINDEKKIPEESGFQYYDPDLIAMINVMEKKALNRTINDCRYAIDYFKREKPERIEFFEYCISLCKYRYNENTKSENEDI
jgi:hypothetical protein